MKTKNVYSLPCNNFSLAVSDPSVHSSFLKYAIDFLMPEGSEIIAPCDGEVTDIKIDSDKSGPDCMQANDANYITIKHGGEYSQFIHLKQNSNLVSLGDEVKKGQVIALSGNTGFSTEPHLHFHVFRYCRNEYGFRTLEIRLDKELEIFIPIK